MLKVERVRPEDNFFEIGGHSLLATQVISRIRNTFGVEIGVMSIFQEAKIEGLGRRVEELIKAGKKELAPPLVRVTREAARGGGLPLSFAQQRLWFLDQLVPNNPLYNCPRAVRLEGELNLEVLERVINEIVRRHEVLRTRIETEEGVPMQVIDEWRPRSLEMEDLTNLPPHEGEREAERITREESETGFDLRRGPLLRVKVLKLGAEDHVVLFTTHHIVSDGWSMGILIREVAALYQAYGAGAASPLKELPIQYADFAVWQREWLKGEVLKEELGYWQKQLAGLEELQLPSDHPRPAVPSYRGAGQPFIVEREVAARLRELCQREGVTLFMALLGGLDILLSRYAGQDDVVLGTDIANRNRAEVEGVIGFFVNQLVLRVEVKGSESFGTLMKQVREVCLGAYAHQDVPFEKLVEALQPERDLSRSPLFQVKLILQNIPRESLELEGLKLGGGGSEVETAKLDLTMVITDVGHGLVGVVEYSRDLFEAETIRRLTNHYTNLLRAIVEKGERSISELNMLSDQESAQIIVEWNETTRPYPQALRIHELVAEQAARSPERIALIDQNQEMTYGELNRRANQMGRYLQRLGVGSEVVVGVYLERSVEMVLGLLAALKAGGCYLPLDPKYPLERVSYMLEDAGVGVVVTEQRLETRLPAFWGRTLCLDAEWESVREEAHGDPESGSAAENLAYVIYTSGSTGRPKGVMLTHQGLCNLVEVQREAFKLGEHSRVLQFASLSFDASVWEIFSTLIAGGSLSLSGQERLMPGDSLLRTLREEEITVMTLPPTALAVLEPEELPHVQTVIAAGEACSAELVERWARGRRFFNAYGPTESTVCASMERCEAGGNGRPTIGRPIANTQLYILDHHLMPAPMRVPSDLYISGVGLARGYLGRPELTAERFIPNPCAAEHGERLYRTGDLGRYLPDGSVEFIGRTDAQVKVRGYRIELGEIEAVLNGHPGVTQSAVITKDDGNGGLRLLGYVVGLGRVTAPDLKEHLRKQLPEYMIPETMTVLETMPVTVNGKIDRGQLLARSETRQSKEGLIGPRDVLEFQLMQIWESVLGIQSIDVRDNFFNLGGHSLLAAGLMARIRNVVGRELPLSALFQGGTIEYLASLLRQDAASLSWSCLVELQGSGSRPPLVLVHPAGGHVLCYLDLARGLGSDQPVYGLQAAGLYGERALFTSIEEIAAHYIEQLSTIQPEGPYFLGGWSSGGTIAYEMAQQLTAQGQKVAQLLLLDSMAHVSQEEDLDEDDATLLMNTFSRSLPITEEELRPLEGDERLDFIIRRAKAGNLLPPDLEVAQVRSFLKIYKTNVKAVHHYTPQVYPGAATLFKTTKPTAASRANGSATDGQTAKTVKDPTKGWGQLAAGGVRIVDVPGTHATMLDKPHVDSLALRIQTCLDESGTADERSGAIKAVSRSYYE
ncbi:MAG TPA: amino acid adenylation domain-containing protein [Blastocatellia bacterium]|nr:amino acid adenylation domain-containing protein [Blastocatellia bacterium]